MTGNQVTVESLTQKPSLLLRIPRWFFGNKIITIISFLVTFFLLMMIGGCLTGVGDYQANISVVEMEKSDVEKMLPSGITLHADPAKKTHPVVFVFGQQSNVVAKLSILGFDLFIPTFFEHYNEMIVGVPYARLGSKKTDFIYMPMLRLDNIWAVIAGWFYGFNKHRAQFEIEGNTYTVLPEVSRQGKSLAQSISENMRIIADPAWISATFNQPLLGQALGMSICSDMDWNFNDAVMEESRMTVTVSPKLVKGMPETNLSVLPITSGGLGAFFLNNNWELTAPGPCWMYE